MSDSSSTFTASLPPDNSPAGRILRAAHQHLFSFGYSTLTMDALPHDLGMSKKTLYVHFPSKDALASAIVDFIGKSLRTRMDAVLADPAQTFVQKLCAIVDIIGGTMAKASPAMFRDLQRFAPEVYRKIEATEFWLQAIRGLVQPEVLERTQLTIRQTLEKAINLFLAGVLSPAGCKLYENHRATCEKHPTS